MQHMTDDEISKLLNAIHDEATAAMASGAPDTMSRALDNIRSMTVHRHAEIDFATRVRGAS